jgi:hypothetical protein
MMKDVMSRRGSKGKPSKGQGKGAYGGFFPYRFRSGGGGKGKGKGKGKTGPIVPADEIIRIERKRLARIISAKFESGEWDTTYSAEDGVSLKALMELLKT